MNENVVIFLDCSCCPSLRTVTDHNLCTLIIARPPANKGSSVPVVSRWLGLGNRTFLEVASMVGNWWIVAFLLSGNPGWKHSMYSNIIIIVNCCNNSLPHRIRILG